MTMEYDSKSRMINLSIVYLVICILSACIGVLLSFTAQPGGITQSNAFIAPFMGPWSQILPPNAHQFNTWTPRYSLFTQLMTAILACSIIGSYLASSRLLRYPSIIISILLLILWNLAGLVKVVSQLA